MIPSGNFIIGCSNLCFQMGIFGCVCSFRGLDWDTQLHGIGTTVHRLLMELYEKAGDLRCWGLIRMISGMLRKKVEELDWVRQNYPIWWFSRIWDYHALWFSFEFRLISDGLFVMIYRMWMMKCVNLFVCVFVFVGLLWFTGSSKALNGGFTSWTEGKDHHCVS